MAAHLRVALQARAAEVVLLLRNPLRTPALVHGTRVLHTYLKILSVRNCAKKLCATTIIVQKHSVTSCKRSVTLRKIFFMPIFFLYSKGF
jgi:hypothetical protein